MFMDGTNSLNLALEEAKHIQTENPHYKVGVDAEEWPTLTSMKYRWYRLTGLGEGFGVEFQRKYSHKPASVTPVWPKS